MRVLIFPSKWPINKALDGRKGILSDFVISDDLVLTFYEILKIFIYLKIGVREREGHIEKPPSTGSIPNEWQWPGARSPFQFSYVAVRGQSLS